MAGNGHAFGAVVGRRAGRRLRVVRGRLGRVGRGPSAYGLRRRRAGDDRGVATDFGAGAAGRRPLGSDAGRRPRVAGVVRVLAGEAAVPEQEWPLTYPQPLTLP